jgi:hypothetical protein
MSEQGFVPADFVVPVPPSTARFRLEPLGPRHNDADRAAWLSSIAHIRATAGFRGRSWPPIDGMSAAENLRDLVRHAEDFAHRIGFTYTVLDPLDNDVIGCVYVYPDHEDPRVASVRSWVRVDRADLDEPLYREVEAWIADHWPFETVRYAAR